MAGTGSKQEDQIITVALEKAVGKKMTYVPFKGGGDVAVQLVGKHVDSTVNNPIEAIAHWRSGALRPLCVFDSKPMPYPNKVTATQSWQDIPTCKSQGLDVEYLMLRGIFMPAGVTPEQVDFYVDLFKKVRATPDWKKFTEDAAFNDTFMTGKEYADWVKKAEAHAQDADAGSRLPREVTMADRPTSESARAPYVADALGGAGRRPAVRARPALVVIADSLRVGIALGRRRAAGRLLPVLHRLAAGRRGRAGRRAGADALEGSSRATCSSRGRG